MSNFSYMICTLSPSIVIGAYKMYLAYSLLGKFNISIEESKTHNDYRKRLKKVDILLYISIGYMFFMFMFYKAIVNI
jgi:hypothetical protein